MRLHAAVILSMLLPPIVHVQTMPDRQFRDGTLVSKVDPPVKLEINKTFQYAGKQEIDIFKVAGAEQYFFVDATPDSTIRRFIWVQFEHYYDNNNNIYDYSGIKQQSVQFDSIEFMGDISVVPDYFTSATREGSDSKAGQQFLRAKGFKIDGTFVRLRLFHLPDTSRRKELMIIYGESIQPDSQEKLIRSEIIQHAQENLKIEGDRQLH